MLRLLKLLSILACPLLPLPPRPALGKLGAPATACGLERKASTARFAGSNRLFWLVGTPAGRQPVKNPIGGRKIVSMPRLGVLHHRYDLAA